MTDNRRPSTTTRITDPTHERLKELNRDGETLSGTIGRALDALEREQDLPEAVAEAMGADGDTDTATEGQR